jgi:hypothetical protein
MKKIKWDDESPKRWLVYFGIKHSRLDECKAAIKRLKYKTIKITQVKRKNYSLLETKLQEHSNLIDLEVSVGTFFCRKKPNKEWFLKDGNHRYLCLVIKGVTEFRIAYDPENKI